MKFDEINWADSEIENIVIEFDCAKLTIWNDVLQKRLLVCCSGLAGITNVCIWDDMIINSSGVCDTTNIMDDFTSSLYSTYRRDYDYGGRVLNDGLLVVWIELVNLIRFRIYCQNVEVLEL